VERTTGFEPATLTLAKDMVRVHGVLSSPRRAPLSGAFVHVAAACVPVSRQLSNAFNYDDSAELIRRAQRPSPAVAGCGFRRTSRCVAAHIDLTAAACRDTTAGGDALRVSGHHR
jgi:hypothetical protein